MSFFLHKSGDSICQICNGITSVISLQLHQLSKMSLHFVVQTGYALECFFPHNILFFPTCIGFILTLTTVLLFKITILMLLSGIQCSHASAHYYPCQIQSFFARMYGSGGGNLLRVHLNNRGVPTDVTFRGTCDSATLKFTSKF